MLNFQEWFQKILLENIPLNKREEIQKGIEKSYVNKNKKYLPGTFGVEIEFSGEDNTVDSDYDYDCIKELLKANDYLINQVKRDHSSLEYETIEDWEEDNPEPEDIYNPLVTYFEITSNKKVFNEEEQKELNNFSRQLDGLNFSYSTKQLLRALNFTNSTAELIRNTYIKNLNELEEYLITLISDTLENKERLVELIKKFTDFHNKELDYYEEEDLKEVHIEKFNNEYENWEVSKIAYEEEIENYFDEGYEKDLDDAIQELIDNERFSRFLSREQIIGCLEKHYDTQNKINNYIDIINDLGFTAEEGDSFNHIFGVGEDGDNIVEVRTGILTIKDLPKLEELLNIIYKNEETNKNHSAHVHIGMPIDTDAFDLLTMLTLTDEKEILKRVSSNRNFTRFAKDNSTAQRYFVQKIMSSDLGKNEGSTSKVFTNQEILSLIQNSDRYMGTNISVFFRTGTVEFRYLSNEVLEDIDDFIEIIKYFLLLPKLARTKKQIKLGNATVTRLSNGQISIGGFGHIDDLWKFSQFTSKGSKPNIPQDKPEDLRKKKIPLKPTSYEDKINNFKAIQKIHTMTSDDFNNLLQAGLSLAHPERQLLIKNAKFNLYASTKIKILDMTEQGYNGKEIMKSLNDSEKNELINFVHYHLL